MYFVSFFQCEYSEIHGNQGANIMYFVSFYLSDIEKIASLKLVYRAPSEDVFLHLWFLFRHHPG